MEWSTIEAYIDFVFALIKVAVHVMKVLQTN